MVDIPTKEQIEKAISSDTWVSQFAKEGKELLDRTNRPNVITAEQFAPYLPIFNMDKERYGFDKDPDYTAHIHRLYNSFLHDLGINLYEVTYVIKSREDETVVAFLNRRFTRIKTDHVEGASSRENIPSVVASNAGQTRDNLVLEASVRDLVLANSTPEQKKYFLRTKMESAVFEKNFVENNMTPEKRPSLNSDESSAALESQDSGDITEVLLDDE